MIRGKDIYAMFREEGAVAAGSRGFRGTKTFRHISEACGVNEDGQPMEGVTPDISIKECRIRDLAANLILNRDGTPVGEGFIQEYFNPRNPGGYSRLFEAGMGQGAVDLSLFAGITGQLLVGRLLQRYKAEEFVASRLIPNEPSMLEQERIPGVTMPVDPDADGQEETTQIPEGTEYKTVGFGEQYVETPLTTKKGLMIAVTKEAIFFDKTGQVASTAGEVGYQLGLRKEKRLLDMMIGAGPQFREKRRGDSAAINLDLFQLATAVSGSGQLAFAYPTRLYPFYNDVPANPLTDEENLKTAEQYFDKTVDPNTGEPIVIGKPFVFACQTRRFDITRIQQATNIWKMSQGGLNSTGGMNTVGPNLARLLLDFSFELSRQLRTRIVQRLYGGTDSSGQADKVWFYGDPAQAFCYMENWPITVVQAPANSEAEFTHDIVLRWKASERGAATVREARSWQRHNFQSQA